MKIEEYISLLQEIAAKHPNCEVVSRERVARVEPVIEPAVGWLTGHWFDYSDGKTKVNAVLID